MEVEALVQAVKAGDNECYGELVRQFRVTVRAFIASYCPNWEAVDDLSQQTFIWAYEHLDEYTPGTNFKAWLKAIARNKLLAELEVKKRHSGRYRKYADFVQVTSVKQELEEVKVDEPDLSEKLTGCVEKLSPDLRELLDLRYREDIALRDLAIKVNKPENVLKGMLFRVRQVLKRCVERQGNLPVQG